MSHWNVRPYCFDCEHTLSIGQHDGATKRRINCRVLKPRSQAREARSRAEFGRTSAVAMRGQEVNTGKRSRTIPRIRKPSTDRSYPKIHYSHSSLTADTSEGLVISSTGSKLWDNCSARQAHDVHYERYSPCDNFFSPNSSIRTVCTFPHARASAGSSVQRDYKPRSLPPRL